MDGGSQVATNWFRSAVNSIVRRSDKLPREAIQAYFDNRENAHLGRLLAFELLTNQQPALAKKIIPTLIDDPSLPLRALAIKWYIQRAKDSTDQQAFGYLGVALEKARDWEQVLEIAELLQDKGIEIDLRNQLGFLSDWQLVGTFDNKDEAGFDAPYGPELKLAKIDTEAKYEDMDGKQSGWQAFNSNSATAMVDLNQVIGKVKGATVYALTEFDAVEERAAEIRIGSANAHKIWINGQEVMSNEIYHNSNSIDKFSAPIKLQEGKNTVLIKVCQNEQTEPWAQRWEFQVRICDAAGKAITPAKPAPTR